MLKISLRHAQKFFALRREHQQALFIALFCILRNLLIVFVFKIDTKTLLSRQAKLPRPKLPFDLGIAILAVEKVSARLRPSPSCLIQALALRDVLLFMGEGCEIRLLARRASEPQFEFHAAVFMKDKYIFGDHDEWQEASVLRLC